MQTISMTTDAATAASGTEGSLTERAGRLAAEFAGRAEGHDADDSFVAENYPRMKAEGLIDAGVPAELGGGGAGIGELSQMLRTLAHGCGSTALALAMHTHQVAIPAWRWRHQPPARDKVEPLLRRVATQKSVLVTSGGSDWVGGSGRAERVEGGWRIHARKVFASGSPVGDLMMTSAIADDKVIHFAFPLDAPEVKKLGNWQVLGMRGTGSQDIEIDGLFIPDDKVSLTRNAGEWHPVWHIIATTAIPLIYSVYVGVAESARDLAVAVARGRTGAARNHLVAGEMETRLRSAQIAHASMIAAAEANSPGPESVNEVMIGRRLVEEGAIRAVELAMELAGGPGFYRSQGLERRFRDVQGARYHPMKHESQFRYAGALALGESVATIY